MTAVAAFAILGLSLIASILDRRAKSELHKQKMVLDTALENMSQGLCMFDGDGRIMLFNERYSELMGHNTIPLQGRLLIDVLQDLHGIGEWDGDPEEFCGAPDRRGKGRQHRDPHRQPPWTARSASSTSR